MAGVEAEFIGRVLHAIDYGQALGAPLAAMLDAQSRALNEGLNFILNVGFENNPDGTRQTRYAEFEFEESHAGKTTTRKLKIPLILLVNPKQLIISEAVVSFDLEISQSATEKQNINGGGEANARIGWGPFSVGFKAKGSYSKENTRKTDTRAKQHVQITVKPEDPPEAIALMMEIMRESCLGAAAGSVPALPQPVPRETIPTESAE